MQLNINLHNILDSQNDTMKEYTHIILGISIYKDGEIQDEWKKYIQHLNYHNLFDKTIAIFALANQEQCHDKYFEGMGTIYDKVMEAGATVIGSWGIDENNHHKSVAIRYGEFVGLPLNINDQDNQTIAKTKLLAEQILPYFLK